jgi:hypothetical protein
MVIYVCQYIQCIPFQLMKFKECTNVCTFNKDGSLGNDRLAEKLLKATEDVFGKEVIVDDKMSIHRCHYV